MIGHGEVARGCREEGFLKDGSIGTTYFLACFPTLSTCNDGDGAGCPSFLEAIVIASTVGTAARLRASGP